MESYKRTEMQAAVAAANEPVYVTVHKVVESGWQSHDGKVKGYNCIIEYPRDGRAVLEWAVTYDQDLAKDGVHKAYLSRNTYGLIMRKQPKKGTN